jgi:hypothetical protein
MDDSLLRPDPEKLTLQNPMFSLSKFLLTTEKKKIPQSV